MAGLRRVACGKCGAPTVKGRFEGDATPSLCSKCSAAHVRERRARGGIDTSRPGRPDRHARIVAAMALETRDANLSVLAERFKEHPLTISHALRAAGYAISREGNSRIVHVKPKPASGERAVS